MTTKNESVRSSTTSVDIPADSRTRSRRIFDQDLAALLDLMSQTKQAVCFPRNDGEFAARVQTLLDGSHEGPFAAAVQALLRETYPLAVFSPRHELAALDGRRVWYAFRDGSAVSTVDGDTS